VGKARFTNRWEFGALIDGSGVFKTMGRCMLISIHILFGRIV
jgi:hypothetical protein